MGQSWAKNILYYPKELTDEEMRDIPYPRLELYDHVGTKATQLTTTIGLLGGGAMALLRKKEVMQTAFKFSRRGFVLGLAITPIMIEGVLKKSGTGTPEGIYDRVYRIRYNRSQVRSANWCTWAPSAGIAAGALLTKPPASRLMGAVNGCLVGYAVGTVGSAVVPQREKKSPKNETQSQTAS